MNNFSERLGEMRVAAGDRQDNPVYATAMKLLQPHQPPRAPATSQVRAPVSSTPRHAPVPVAAPGQLADLSGRPTDGAKEELRQLPLLDVYRQWFSPAAERVGGGDEVNCSCFNTDFHTGGDVHPQFGINTSKNTYYCHACQVTGDIIDLAAVHLGIAHGGTNWRCPDDLVHEAVRYAGESLCGMTFRKTAAGWQRVQPHSMMPTPAIPMTPLAAAPLMAQGVTPPAPAPAPAPGATPRRMLADFRGDPAAALRPDMSSFTPPPTPVLDPAPARQAPEFDDTEESRIAAADFWLDWRALIPTGTPMRDYLEVVSSDDSPEEYHFWNFMSAIGLALGRKTFLPDSKPVYGNMLLCTVGRTGLSKSRAEGFINELIRTAMPFDIDDYLTTGVRIVKNPGSGEYLASIFKHEVADPTWSTGSGVRGQKAPMLTNPSVKALIQWPEMATMVSKAASKGSIVQTTVIDLYDTPSAIGGGSLTNGSYEAKNPFGVVTTTTQLAAIRGLLSGADAASGFLNRWWFVIGRRKQRQAWGRPIDVSGLSSGLRSIADWSEGKLRTDGGWHRLGTDAESAASEFLVRRCHALEESDDDMLRRAALTFKKLILLFSANMRESAVSLDAVEQAKVAFEYLMDCLQHIGVRIGQSDYEIFADLIVAELMAKPDGVTPRDLRKLAKRKISGINAETVDKYLKAMEEHLIEMKLGASAGVGRPTKRYYLQED